jgi:hypothetical protein
MDAHQKVAKVCRKLTKNLPPLALTAAAMSAAVAGSTVDTAQGTFGAHSVNIQFELSGCP